MFDKTSNFFIFNICCFYTTLIVLMLVSISKFTAFTLDFQNGRPPSSIFTFSKFVKNSNLRQSLRRHAKFGEDRTFLGRVIAYFRFARLVFDGPNILVKLHVDRVYTLQDIAIFIFGQFRLKLPIHAILECFRGYYPIMNSNIVETPKRKVLRRKHVV